VSFECKSRKVAAADWIGREQCDYEPVTIRDRIFGSHLLRLGRGLSSLVHEIEPELIELIAHPQVCRFGARLGGGIDPLRDHVQPAPVGLWSQSQEHLSHPEEDRGPRLGGVGLGFYELHSDSAEF
jgi:hypothetical protein